MVHTMKQTYTTGEVAKAIDVSKNTLLRWLYAGKIPEPAQRTVNNQVIRVWTEKDLQKAKKHREECFYKHP